MPGERAAPDTSKPDRRHPPVTDSIAVTGLGIISPIGVGQELFWSALCEGISGIRTQPEATQVPYLAATLVDYLPRELITSPHLRRMDSLSRSVVAAARLAVGDAGFADVSGEDTGIVVGSALGSVDESVQFLQRAFDKGPAMASPMAFPNLVVNAPASYTAMELGCTGSNLTVSDGEVSSEQAVASACDLLRHGRASRVVVGGGDQFADLVVHAHRRLRNLSSQRGGPEWCSPLDADRNGIVLGEGAAMLLAEPLTAARSRGATVYAEIEATTSFTVPAPVFDWPQRSPQVARRLRDWLQTVLRQDARIDAVFCNANSSVTLDGCHLDVFANLFEDRAASITLFSIKGAIGEFGAAGALTCVAAALALHHQTMPPLCNLRQPPGGSRFKFVGPQAVECQLERVLVFAMARGGLCSALLLRRH